MVPEPTTLEIDTNLRKLFNVGNVLQIDGEPGDRIKQGDIVGYIKPDDLVTGA